MIDEPTIRAALIDLLETQIPDMAGHISGPADTPPTEETAYVYIGPTTYAYDGIEVGLTTITIQVCTPYAGGGSYLEHHDRITSLAVAVLSAIKTAMDQEFAGLVLTGPATIGPTGVGIFRPTQTETIAASVTFAGEAKGAIE